MSSRNILKGWFSSRKRPFATQFADWIDSYWHKDEDLIPIASIENLQKVLLNKADKSDLINLPPVVVGPGVPFWIAPAGTFIDKIIVSDPASIDFSIGSQPGAEDIKEAEVHTGPKTIFTYDIDLPASQTIYFNNITPNTVIKLLRR